MVRAVYLSVFVVLSLAAGGIYYSYTRETTVVVAHGDLRVGSIVTEASVSVRRVHPGSVPVGTARRVSDVVGRYVAWPVLDGQYVSSRALTSNRTALIDGGLTVPAGYHAISLPVTAAEAVGGVLRPGDFVDILAVAKNQLPGATAAPAQVLGRRLLVLGLRTDQGQPLDTGGPGSVHGLNFSNNRIGSVLLAVPTEDEEKYATAEASSQFTVVLDLD